MVTANRLAMWLCAALTFCCNSQKTSSQDEARQDSSAQDAAPPPPEPARVAAPEDIRVSDLRKELACPSLGEACRLLEAFEKAGSVVFDAPSGTARWLGRGYVRRQGEETKQRLIVWATRVPTAQVSPGLLPLKFGMGELPEHLGVHGDKLIQALSRGSDPSNKNQARPFVEAFVPDVQRGAIQADARSLVLVAERPAYFRQPERRKLVMVLPDTESDARAGDGIYAELWQASW
jgi:hypothetical protein